MRNTEARYGYKIDQRGLSNVSLIHPNPSKRGYCRPVNCIYALTLGCRRITSQSPFSFVLRILLLFHCCSVLLAVNVAAGRGAAAGGAASACSLKFQNIIVSSISALSHCTQSPRCPPASWPYLATSKTIQQKRQANEHEGRRGIGAAVDDSRTEEACRSNQERNGL